MDENSALNLTQRMRCSLDSLADKTRLHELAYVLRPKLLSQTEYALLYDKNTHELSDVCKIIHVGTGTMSPFAYVTDTLKLLCNPFYHAEE